MQERFVDEEPVHRLLPEGRATRWADLSGMLGDIDRCRAACRRILRLQGKTEPDAELIDMLWHYALLAYGRCLGRGARVVPAAEIVDQLDEQGREMHEFYMVVRDKFVAHSVNDLEQDLPAVALRDPQAGEPAFLGVTTVQVRAVPSGRRMVQGMLQQCFRVERALVRLIRPLGMELDAWASAQPVTELYSLPHVDVRVDSERVGERRPHPQMRSKPKRAATDPRARGNR